MVNRTQSKLASISGGVLFGSAIREVLSFQSSPAVIVSRCRMVIRRLRSSRFWTAEASKYFRTGVSSVGEFLARRRDADDHRGDRLGDRLHRVQIAAPIERVPPGIEVVVGTRRVGAGSTAPACFASSPVDAVVVMVVRAVVDHFPMADDQHAVDVAVLPARRGRHPGRRAPSGRALRPAASTRASPSSASESGEGRAGPAATPRRPPEEVSPLRVAFDTVERGVTITPSSNRLAFRPVK